MGACGGQAQKPNTYPAKPTTDSQASSQVNSLPGYQGAVQASKTGPTMLIRVAPFPQTGAQLPPQPLFQVIQVNPIPSQPLVNSQPQFQGNAFPQAIPVLPSYQRVEALSGPMLPVSPQIAASQSVPKTYPQKTESVAPSAGQVFQLQVKDIKGSLDFTIPINSKLTGQGLFNALREKMSGKKQFQVVHFGKPIKCDEEEIGKSGLFKDTLIYCIFKPN